MFTFQNNMRDVKKKRKTDTHKEANYQKTTCKMENMSGFRKSSK